MLCCGRKLSNNAPRPELDAFNICHFHKQAFVAFIPPFSLLQFNITENTTDPSNVDCVRPWVDLPLFRQLKDMKMDHLFPSLKIAWKL